MDENKKQRIDAFVSDALEELKYELNIKGITQQEIADAIGISQSKVSILLTGKETCQVAKIRAINAICDHFGLDIDTSEIRIWGVPEKYSVLKGMHDEIKRLNDENRNNKRYYLIAEIVLKLAECNDDTLVKIRKLMDKEKN